MKMNSLSPDDAVLHLDDNGRVLSATAAAVSLFAGRGLEGLRLDEILNRTLGRGEWTCADGSTFTAESFGIRRNDRLDLRLVLPDPADNTIARRRSDNLLRITADVFRAGNVDLDEAIVDALGRMGRLIRVDRAYVFLMTGDDSATNTHEWSRAGTDPQIDHLGDVPRSAFHWFEKHLNRDGYLVVQNLDEIPPGAADARALLEDQGIRSLLSVGMFEGDQLRGFVGFDAVSRELRASSRTIERLKWIAELFIQSLLRAQAQERLRNQEELFQYVRLATNDIIWDVDLVQETAWRSEAVESMLGVPAGHDRDSISWIKRIHPEDVSETRAKLSRLFADPNANFLQHTYRARHSDGHWVYILDRGYVIRDDQGRAVRMIGTSTDLTERMQTVRELEISEARFRAVVENVSDVIAIVDTNGTIVYQSPSSARVFGYSPTELIGRSTFSHVHPDDRERLEAMFADGIENDIPEARATFRYRHAAGHWLRVETVGANFGNRDEVGGIVLVSRDISQRRQIEQQLERSARLASLGHLASSVAHEFNNVLMGAQPFVEVIRRTTDPSKVAAAAERIGDALDRGKDISRDLLQFARPMAVSMDTFDLRSWLQSLEDEIQRIVPEALRVVVTVPTDPLPAVGDPIGLHQSLLNLVLHAGEVLENVPDGTIEICARKASSRDKAASLLSGDPEDFVALSVSDNGPEIEPGALEHIFEPMFRARRTSPEGLGLTVVHQLVTAQGGQARAVSTERGTTFHLFLRSRRDPTATERAVPHPDSTQEAPSLILLVEDNEIVASGIAAVLELDDQKVEIAHTGAEALERLSRELPSVVILDIGLPDMSGIEVYEQIEKLYPDLPVVFSSGHGDQQELKRYLDRPNVEFLLKPYDAETLMTIVERLRAQRSENAST